MSPLSNFYQAWIPTFDYLAKDASVSARRSPSHQLWIFDSWHRVINTSSYLADEAMFENGREVESEGSVLSAEGCAGQAGQGP
jgi:hypothetical protein